VYIERVRKRTGEMKEGCQREKVRRKGERREGE
jgi:hypothetical protein